MVYFTANPNSQSEVVTIYLSPTSRARKKVFDFANLSIKGHSSQGNIVTRHQIKRVVHKDVGAYLLTSYDLTNRYNRTNILIKKKFNPDYIFSAVHYDAEADNIYVKRFKVETQTIGRPFFISESQGSRLLLISADENPIIAVEYLKGRQKQKCTEQINLAEFIDIKGWKARGNRLSTFTISGVRFIEKTEDEPLAEGHDDEENPEGENHDGENSEGENPGVESSEREHPEGYYFNTDNKSPDGKNRKEQLKLFDKVMR